MLLEKTLTAYAEGTEKELRGIEGVAALPGVIDDARFAMEIPATHGQLTGAVFRNVSRDRHGVGENAHIAVGHLAAEMEARRAAVNDDETAVTHERRRLVGDRPLGLDGDIAVFYERQCIGTARCSEPVGRSDAAMNFPGHTRFIQLVDIPPHGRSRNAGDILKLLHRDERSIQKQVRNCLVAIEIAHLSPPWRSFLCRQAGICDFEMQLFNHKMIDYSHL